ncbi:MAG: transcriptional repressor LexA [Myxococcales bacterium]|nr:transcriptional repressor LexA [Myxococcales bacterium]
MSPRTELTSKQQNVLDFVHTYQCENGFPPSIREIGEHFGIRSTNGVVDHLRALERKGFLQHTENRSRSLQVVRGGRDEEPVADVPDFVAPAMGDVSPIAPHALRRRAPGIAPTHTRAGRVLGNRSVRDLPTRPVEVPLLGQIAAGQPLLAVEASDEALVIDSFLLGGPGEVFALRVVGESMVEAGIFPGDFLFVRKQSSARPGDIVVALVDGEATVKRFFPEGDRVRLQPENRAMAPIYVRGDEFRDLMLLGSVVGIYRKL